MNSVSSGWPWVLRVVWVLQPLAFVPLVEDATSTLGASGRVFAIGFAWAAWAAVLLSTLVPSTVSLTAGRLASPLLLVVTATCAVGADVAGWKLIAAGGAALLAILVWFSAETGIALAQGSAYGAEQRFPLKSPVVYVVPMVVLWSVMAATTIGAVILLANEFWIVGGVVLALGAGATVFIAPRFHQLSRRWLVVVPVGIVVLDPMLLVENALFRTSELSAIRLAPADTEALDLTGGTGGVALEIVLHTMATVVKTERGQPNGTALHVRSVLVSPSRPGRALAAASARRLPVG